MEACPYQAVRLAPITALFSFGTPFIDPGRTPCYLCMRCPAACPTDALTVLTKTDVRMGLAVIDQDTCLSYNDAVCNLCYASCPLKDEAVTMDELLRPAILDGCVGCGVCEHVCPTDEPSVRVIPRAP